MKGKSETLCCSGQWAAPKLLAGAGWSGANVWVTRVTALLFSDHIQHLPCPLPLPALPTQNWFHHHVSQSEMILRVSRLWSVEVCCKAVKWLRGAAWIVLGLGDADCGQWGRISFLSRFETAAATAAHRAVTAVVLWCGGSRPETAGVCGRCAAAPSNNNTTTVAACHRRLQVISSGHRTTLCVCKIWRVVRILFSSFCHLFSVCTCRGGLNCCV